MERKRWVGRLFHKDKTDGRLKNGIVACQHDDGSIRVDLYFRNTTFGAPSQHFLLTRREAAMLQKRIGQALAATKKG